MASEPHVDGTAPMDYSEHEKTYDLFLGLTAVLTPVFITWVVAVGIGGMKHHPVIALLFVLASLVAAAVGMARKPANMMPAVIVLILSFLAFVLV